jgi:hypothetical protein
MLSISVNPLSLAQEPDKKSASVLPNGYVSYNDTSDCPVKILGYRIDLIDSNETAVRLLLKNASDLQVVGYQGTFELFDSEGKNIDSVQGDSVFTFKERQPIPADSRPSEGSVYIVEEGHMLKNIKPQITQVLFEDQSIWRGF